MRYINKSAVKALALGFSAKHRAGKFNRVGSDFLAIIDEEARRMAQPPLVDPEPFPSLLSKEAKSLIIAAAERKMVEALKTRVMAHPSLGKTLKA